MIYQIVVGMFTLLLVAACSPTKKIQTVSSNPVIKETQPKELPYQFPYTINTPNTSFELPKILEEISGLSMCEKEDVIYAIQDENGIIFQLDKNTGTIVKQKRFHDDGDYEGIEVVGETIYVVKSSGNIYEVKDLWTDNPKREKFKFFLTKENNIEGLTFDPANNRLILTAKGFVPDKVENQNHRLIYSFDLKNDSLNTKPIFQFNKDEMKKFVGENVPKEQQHLFSIMNPGKGEFKLGPSGVAIHPISKNIYVVSSRGKVLIVCRPDGSLLHFEKLDKKIHAQPEGITFDEAGNLYISSEAKDNKKARLSFFEMNPKK